MVHLSVVTVLPLVVQVRMRMRFVPCLSLAAGVALILLTNGCAVRATTDFGPGEEPHHRSLGTGAGPFPNLLSTDGRHDLDDTAVPKDRDAEALDDGRTR